MAEKQKETKTDENAKSVKHQTEQSNLVDGNVSRRMAVTRKGNVVTTVKANGTVIVNCVAEAPSK